MRGQGSANRARSGKKERGLSLNQAIGFVVYCAACSQVPGATCFIVAGTYILVVPVSSVFFFNNFFIYLFFSSRVDFGSVSFPLQFQEIYVSVGLGRYSNVFLAAFDCRRKRGSRRSLFVHVSLFWEEPCSGQPWRL